MRWNGSLLPVIDVVPEDFADLVHQLLLPVGLWDCPDHLSAPGHHHLQERRGEPPLTCHAVQDTLFVYHSQGTTRLKIGRPGSTQSLHKRSEDINQMPPEAIGDLNTISTIEESRK